MLRKSNIVVIVIIVIILLGVWWFVSSQSQPNPVPLQQNIATNSNPSVPSNNNNPSSPVEQPTPQTTNPTPATDKPITPSSVSVNIQNFAFVPSTLSIKKGTKVTWTNNDSVAHTVTSDSGSLLNSGTIQPGASFTFTFTNTGSTNYHCAVHPMMKGNIVVS